MKIAFKVSAQELLDKGAPLTAIRQSYRPYDVYTEKAVSEEVIDGVRDAKIIYESSGSARDNHFYYLPAKDADGNDVTAVAANAVKTVVWGGSIKDSYVKVTAAS